MRRKAASVNSEAWLPVVPQLNKLQKQVAHFCHSLVASFFSTLQRGSSTSSQSTRLFIEEDVLLLLYLPRICGIFIWVVAVVVFFCK